jgi:hypothetical protein
MLKMLTETLLRISFSVIGQYSLVPTSHWLQGKCSRINLSSAAFDILQTHSRLPVSLFSVIIPALGSLKRVTERIFKLAEVGSAICFSGPQYAIPQLCFRSPQNAITQVFQIFQCAMRNSAIGDTSAPHNHSKEKKGNSCCGPTNCLL